MSSARMCSKCTGRRCEQALALLEKCRPYIRKASKVPEDMSRNIEFDKWREAKELLRDIDELGGES